MSILTLHYRSRPRWRLFLFLTLLTVIATIGICFASQSQPQAAITIPQIAVEYGEPPPLILIP